MCIAFLFTGYSKLQFADGEARNVHVYTRHMHLLTEKAYNAKQMSFILQSCFTLFPRLTSF